MLPWLCIIFVSLSFIWLNLIWIFNELNETAEHLLLKPPAKYYEFLTETTYLFSWLGGESKDMSSNWINANEL